MAEAMAESCRGEARAVASERGKARLLEPRSGETTNNALNRHRKRATRSTAPRSLRANELLMMLMALHRADYAGNYSGRKQQTSPAVRLRRRSRGSLIDRRLGWHVGGVNSHTIQGRSESIECRPLLLLR